MPELLDFIYQKNTAYPDFTYLRIAFLHIDLRQSGNIRTRESDPSFLPEFDPSVNYNSCFGGRGFNAHWICSSVRTGNKDDKRADRRCNEFEEVARRLRFKMLHVALSSSDTDIMSVSRSPGRSKKWIINKRMNLAYLT